MRIEGEKIPVDVPAATEADLKYTSYAAGRVQTNLEGTGAALSIV